MTAQYTFVMKDLRKLVPPKREILKGIWLSFYPGAKIGVLGNNGAGKSTLLRIMAGVDKEFLGEAWPAPGLKIGYLPQEPQLDPAKDVKGNVEEGVEETRKLLARFEEVSMKLGEDMSPAKMEKLLEEFKGTVVAITHDRYFLDNVAKWILELDRGEGHPFEGNYSGWLELKAKRLRDEEKQAGARERMLARELEWVRSSVKARQAKSKARLQRYDEMVAEAQKEARDPSLEIVIPPGPRLGGEVVAFDGVSKAYGDRLLIDNLTFKLPRGGIVGVIGPNGAGKTTLFRMIMGHEKPDKGTIKIGETVQLGYVDQSRDALADDKTIYDEISEGAEALTLGERQINARAYV